MFVADKNEVCVTNTRDKRLQKLLFLRFYIKRVKGAILR